MTPHEIVSRDQWLAERRALLVEEKAWTRERDRLAAKLRALPWVRVDKQYVFDSAEGRVTLPELFGGRNQLIVYHFMFGPDWQQGCVGCSLLCDHVDGARQHFEHNVLADETQRKAQPIRQRYASSVSIGARETATKLTSTKNGNLTDWVRRHDEYPTSGRAAS